MSSLVKDCLGMKLVFNDTVKIHGINFGPASIGKLSKMSHAEPFLYWHPKVYSDVLLACHSRVDIISYTKSG